MATENKGVHPAIHLLDTRKDQIMAAVPQTFRAALTWERIRQAVGTAIAKSKYLADCKPVSIYTSVLEIVGKGLDLGMDGQAYLVPFKGECTPMIGSQGKIELAYRSGMIDNIVCQVIYENDTIDLDLATGQVHHPMTIADLQRIAKDGGRGEMLAAYARVWVKGAGQPILELMTLDEFHRIRDAAASRTGKLSPAYKAWPSEMFRRSVLNRALKRAPKSRDLMELLNREMELEPVGAANREAGNVIDADEEHDQGPAPRELPDHGEPEDVEAELERLKSRERAASRPADEPPFPGDDDGMPS